MKKLVSLLLAVALLVSVFSTLAVAEEKVTVSLLTTRNSTATNDIEDVWFFKYLAQKMNVDFELEQTLETDQRISLMFASDSVPDLVWGIGLSNNDVMVYGVQEGMLLNWKDLITPELMPNTYQAMQDYPDAFTASTAPDGNIYTLPMITGSSYYANTGSFSAAIRMYINKDWMDACGITEIPTTLDEYLEVLRTFKEKDPMGLGENNIPLIGNQEKDKTFVWNALGFHGTATQAYGTSFDLKDNQLVLPCYTEEAKEFITFYNTLYNEGLISPDYFTLDQTAARGLMASGVCGVLGDSTLTAIGDAWPSWVALSPLTSDVNDVAVAAFNPGYSVGQLYASAYTVHPEVLARIVDYMYSGEGALDYFYGPVEGTEETLGMVDGWYYDENNRITRVADLSTVINDYVTAESAKFIVGTRPLSELDAYFEELKSLGIEEYIAIYQEAYAPFLETLQ